MTVCHYNLFAVGGMTICLTGWLAGRLNVWMDDDDADAAATITVAVLLLLLYVDWI